MPWLCVQTCSPVSGHRAMAQDGAIEACATKGREYSRRIVRAFVPATRNLAHIDQVVSTG